MYHAQPQVSKLVLAELSAQINGVHSRRSNLVAQVVEAIRAAVQDRRLPSGAKLANENVFAAQLNVSRTTLREAIRILTHDGLLISRHGIGTFVAEHPPARVKSGLERMSSTTELILAAGGEPGTRSYTWAAEQVPFEAAQALEVPEGSAGVLVRRTRLINGRPLMCTQEYLPAHILGDTAHLEHFDGQSLYAFLRDRIDLHISYCASTITAIKAQGQVAQELEVEVGEALVVLKQVHFNQRGQPVLYSINHHNPQLMDFYLVRTEVAP